jgi:hypothetical protein
MFYIIHPDFVIVNLCAGKTKKGRISVLVQSKTLKPRGDQDGPKRTPPHLGDKWQHLRSFEVEQVIYSLHG